MRIALDGSQHEENCVFFVWEVQRLLASPVLESYENPCVETSSQMTFWLQRIWSDRLRIDWDGRRVDDICGEPCGFICASRSETVGGDTAELVLRCLPG